MSSSVPISGEGSPGPRVGHALAWWLLLAASLLVLAFGNVPEPTRLWDAVFDAGHAPLFGLIALAVHGLLGARPGRASGARRSWLAFAIAVAVGAAAELFQTLQWNREASLADLLRDAAGAGAVLLLVGARKMARSGAPPGRASGVVGPRGAVLLAVVLLGGALAQLGTTAAAYVERNRAMPTLFALDGAWWERRFIEEHDAALTPRSRPNALAAAVDESLACLDLRPGAYPGLAFDEPYPDWSSYRRFVFTVVSDLEAPIQLLIRVHDAAHDQRHADRFNRALTVSPGVNRFAIPVDDIRRAPDRRQMDVRRIRGVILFADRLKTPLRVYLGAFRLE